MDEVKTCRTCRYWQGILPKGKDTSWSGCMIMKRKVVGGVPPPSDWVEAVGVGNYEVMGPARDIVATKDDVTCKYHKLVSRRAASEPGYQREENPTLEAFTNSGEHPQVYSPHGDAVTQEVQKLSYHVYRREVPDEGRILDALLHYRRD